MKQREKIVFYNPRAVFYTMPLSLLAVASYLDSEKYEVVIVDGRLETDPVEKLLKELEGAICLGVTVLTGAPIKDALHVTIKVKEKFPRLTVVWGGWHPSLFPEQVLSETKADVVVKGQGEITFSEVLDRIKENMGFESLPGISYKKNDVVITNPDRPVNDINNFPPVNYGLINVNDYVRLSGRNQIDYIASQGCRFRCGFCADPFMYKRGWFGYSPSRLANELEHLWEKYHFEHVHFQDETFFTQNKRVEQIADEFLKRKLGFSWFATMRADQGSRFAEEVFAKCKKSGLERVMIGLESGSQRMLDWMKKDIKISQVFESAEKCLRHGIAINFSSIIGFPGETESDINETMKVIRELRKMSPEFRVSIFYFKPYPGNDIADELIKEGYQLPKGISEWADFDYVGSNSVWVENKKMEEIEHFKFYQRLAWTRNRIFLRPIQSLAAWRCETSTYSLPVEKWLYEKFSRQVQLS